MASDCGMNRLLSRRRQYWLALFLLVILFGQTGLTASRTSLTTDEGLHITSGYSILRTGDYRLIEEHPPLIKLLAALPLLPVTDLADPRTLPAWEADSTTPDTVHLVRVMKQWLQPYRPFDRVVYAARVPIMLLALVLGAVVFRWASDVAGPWAGLMALALYTFDPNMVAHSSVAAIDLGTAAFITFASYAFWRALRRPTRTSVALAGVTLGLAQAAKISALMLLPLFVVLASLRAITAHDPALLSNLRIHHWAHTITRGQMLARFGLLMFVMLLLAGLTLWGIYGFEIRTPPGWSIPIPAASHLIPLERVRHDIAQGRTTFLMGQYSERGWWYYFPVAFAVKTPIPTLLLLTLAILLFVRRDVFRDYRNWDALALVSFPLVYFASAMIQPFNIGYRHLLPILPFVFVFISVQISPSLKGEILKIQIPNPHPFVSLSPCLLVSILLVWNMISAIHIFPDYLAYFNELAGGPDNGYKWLVDSNLDWGQSWKELKAYMDAHGIAHIRFAQASSNDPAVYGIDYEPIAPMKGAPAVLPARFDPAPGVYVISPSALQGVALADVNTFDFFRRLTPTARIGHALFVYDVKPVDPPPGWVAMCASPAPPLEPPDIEAGFGRDDLRQVAFDCDQTWVIPGNAASGWVVLPYAAAHDQGTFARRWLNPGELVFEQKQSFALPPHSIFKSQISNFKFQNNMITPSLPTIIGESVELIGYALDRSTARPGQTVELLTFWRVIGRSPGAVSVMAHLTADGQMIAVGDGLGYVADQWQAGDVFAQRNLLHIPPDAPHGLAWIESGLYTLDGNVRLAVYQNGNPAGDTLRLAALSIEP
jgi:hypothetical protein